MDEPTLETAALFNSFDNAMTSGLNDLIQSISSPELRESSILLPTNSSHVAEVSEEPTKRRAPLKDVAHILSASE